MNSKERVLKTISFEEPDRVPTGEWGIDHDHVSKIIGRHTFWRNRVDSTIALWEGRRDEMVDSLKEDYAELIEKMDYDLITVELVPPKGYIHLDPPRKTGDGIWEDSKGNVYKYAASNDSILCLNHEKGIDKLSEEDVLGAMDAYSQPIDPSRFELIDYLMEKFGDEKAFVFRGINVYGCLMNIFKGDFTHQLILSMTAPEEIKRMYQAGWSLNKQLIDKCAKRNIDICMQGTDFCMNTGSFINPDIIRDVYMPFMKTVNNEINKKDMASFFHCCGNTWDILDDFVDAGYKGYQSIQKSCGMDTQLMKDKYGKKMTLWTGLQCETLVGGSREEVEAEVREYLDICMPGGGFIFGSTNSVQYGANTDNYLRALDIVREEGIYKF